MAHVNSNVDGNNLHEWVERLGAEDLPVLRRTIAELGRFAKMGEKVPLQDMADVILLDPLMTLKVMRFINSQRRGRLSSEITTVEHALMMMGVMPFFKQFSNLKAVEDHLAWQEAALTGLRQAMSRAQHAAYQARDLAIQQNDIESEEVYIAALLHELAELVLWCFAPEHMLRRLADAEAAQQAGSLDIKALQVELAAAWKLPELLQMLMDNKSAVRPRILCVMLACSIARQSDHGWYSAVLQENIEAVAGMLRLPLNEVTSRIHHTAVLAARQWQWYQVPPAAAWLPMLPEVLSPQQIWQAAMDEIAAHLDGSLDLHDMMSLALKGMHDGLGLNHVVFALLTEDRAFLKARYIVGAKPGSPLNHFQFDIRAPHLFGRLLEKQQAVWLNDANRATLRPLLPPEIRQVIGDNDFFAMSVLVQGKPIGLFYADRASYPLDESRYQAFKQLCVRAAQGLAHLAAG